MAYYTIEVSYHQIVKIDGMDRAKDKMPVEAYYVYSNCNESLGVDADTAIFTTTREAYVPVDQIKIKKHLELIEHKNDGATVSAGNMLYANIALNSIYSEYRRHQQRSRELLTGLAVPSFSLREQLPQYAKGVTDGNRLSQKGKANGSSDQLLNKGSFKVINSRNVGMVMNSPLAGNHSNNNGNQMSSSAAKSFTSLENTHSSKNPTPPDLPKQGELRRGKKTEINVDHKASEKRGGLAAIVWGIATAQELILANPRITIVLLLIAAMLIKHPAIQ